MVNSRRHKRLVSRIKFLEENLLPNVKISGNYTKKESDLIRSYVLLSHAEIESYFEDVALEKAKKALQKWKTNRTKSNCLLAIMSFCTSEVGWDKTKKEKKEKFDYRVIRVVRYYTEKLNNNHGIKADNVKSILLPIGVEESQIDDTWLNTMESFGAQRGLIGHSTISVQQQIDLVTNKNNINNNILPTIKQLDLLIKGIK